MRRQNSYSTILILAVALLQPTIAPAQNCETPVRPPPTTIANPRPDAFPEVQADIRRKAISGRYRAIAIGDSIIMRWPQAALDTTFGMPVLNAGIGGDGTASIIYRMQTTDWSMQSPDYVILLVGTNDSMFAPCAIFAGLEILSAMIARKLPGAKIGIISILPRGEDLGFRGKTIEDTNRLLDASSHQLGYTFINAYDSFVTGCKGAMPCPLYLPGNLHPSAQGYELLSDIIRKQFINRLSH